MALGNREIKEIPVYCDNGIERSCQWEGTVGMLEAHAATCEYALLPCPLICGDNIIRKDLDAHLKSHCLNRHYECGYCGEQGTYAFITYTHDDTCVKKIVPCPYECPQGMPREDIAKHVKSECINTLVACKYKSIGCEAVLRRGDMIKHGQDDKVHLSKCLDAVMNLHRAAIESQHSSAELLACVVSMSDKNAQVRDKIQQLDHQLVVQHQEAKKSSDMLVRCGQPVVFKVTKFQRKRQRNKMFTSSPFYTSPTGYHVAVNVLVNGSNDAKGTHVSVCALLKKGKFDDEIAWPFVGKLSFTLLNQLSDTNHHCCVLVLDAERNVSVESRWGVNQFISHSELGHQPARNTQYLKDDTLYFRVSVEASGFKHWLECTPDS